MHVCVCCRLCYFYKGNFWNFHLNRLHSAKFISLAVKSSSKQPHDSVWLEFDPSQQGTQQWCYVILLHSIQLARGLHSTGEKLLSLGMSSDGRFVFINSSKNTSSGSVHPLKSKHIDCFSMRNSMEFQNYGL